MCLNAYSRILIFRLHSLMNKYITLVLMSKSKYFKVDFLENFCISGPITLENCYSKAYLSVFKVSNFPKYHYCR